MWISVREAVSDKHINNCYSSPRRGECAYVCDGMGGGSVKTAAAAFAEPAWQPQHHTLRCSCCMNAGKIGRVGVQIVVQIGAFLGWHL